MKSRLILLAAAAIALASCNREPEHFTVYGTVTDSLATLPGSMVYLIANDGPMDSTVVKDGSFTFQGDIDKTAIYVTLLRFPERDIYDTRFNIAFVPDAEEIHINLDYPATVTGSPLSDAITEFQENVINLYYEHDPDIGSLTFDGQMAKADSIYRAQVQKIDNLARETYLANTDNALGLTALGILFEDLDYDELAELVAKGAPFIQEDEQIQTLLDSKKAE